ncbi:MAG: bifunctional glycosyltransferase family 2 protein/CDP-glycerol:glycerophosphate glycerophosphotransferase [Actinocatenispora sp.]
MALLSIIVPSYGVQAYVGECLDSLLSQSFTDIEIIAVDDCSPDRTGQILDSYAARDPRVRVLHLPENRGLGGARNAGFAEATGEYVWFVDSDDWVAPHSLAAIVRRLRETRPDVLMIDYAEAFWDLRTRRNLRHDVLAAAPDVFRVADYPQLFDVFVVAWNKVVRREYLTKLDVPFPTGIYEDIPFTYPLLVAAERISVLNQVCVYYRQRRGSILRSGGERHLELFGQYDLAFERLGQLGDTAAGLIPTIYRQMTKHLFVVIGSGRLSGEYRKRYFRRATELARRLRPAGYRAPGGADGVRFRALTTGSWPMVVALRGGYKLAGGLRRRVRRATGAVSGGLRTFLRLGWTFLLRVYYRLQTRLPVDDNLAIYCANWGRGYTCNPRAIYEKARELAPGVRGVWVVTPEGARQMPSTVDHVVVNTAAFYRVLARARYLVNNNNFGDYFVKRAGTVFVQTHHGTPLKSMGIDERRSPDVPPSRDPEFHRLVRRCDNWDYDLSSNIYSTNIWQRAYPCDFRTLEYGYPRNDVLVDATAEQTAAIRARLGIAPDEKVILYAPTHRGSDSDYRPLFDPSEFVRSLGSGHRLLLRTHYFYGGESGLSDISSQVMDVSAYPVVEDLYLVADVLITDYSSVMFDYGVLDRPIVIYAPDWQAYQATRGTYFDLSAEPPGLFTADYDELVAAFEAGTYDTAETDRRRAAFRERFCVFDDGRAAERTVRKLMLGESPELPDAALPVAGELTAEGPTDAAVRAGATAAAVVPEQSTAHLTS